MNILWIDIETSGLGDNAAILEIAAIPMIDGEIKPHFHSMIRPHKGASLDPQAFEITKININEIWGFPEPEVVLNEFIKWVDSYETIFSLGGHNVVFDRKKLFRYFCRYGEYGSFITRFSNNDTDTIRISRDLFKGKRNKPLDFKLESLCRYFEIETGVHHRALGDIQNTIKLFFELEKVAEKNSIDIKNDIKMSFHEKRRKYLDMNFIQESFDGDVFIPKETWSNKEAAKFILNHLWEKYCAML